MKLIFYTFALIVLFVVPLVIRDPFYVDIMIMVAFNCIIALTWRVIMQLGNSASAMPHLWVSGHTPRR